MALSWLSCILWFPLLRPQLHGLALGQLMNVVYPAVALDTPCIVNLLQLWARSILTVPGRETTMSCSSRRQSSSSISTRLKWTIRRSSRPRSIGLPQMMLRTIHAKLRVSRIYWSQNASNPSSNTDAISCYSAQPCPLDKNWWINQTMPSESGTMNKYLEDSLSLWLTVSVPCFNSIYSSWRKWKAKRGESCSPWRRTPKNCWLIFSTWARWQESKGIWLRGLSMATLPTTTLKWSEMKSRTSWAKWSDSRPCSLTPCSQTTTFAMSWSHPKMEIFMAILSKRFTAALASSKERISGKTSSKVLQNFES